MGWIHRMTGEFPAQGVYNAEICCHVMMSPCIDRNITKMADIIFSDAFFSYILSFTSKSTLKIIPHSLIGKSALVPLMTEWLSTISNLIGNHANHYPACNYRKYCSVFYRAFSEEDVEHYWNVTRWHLKSRTPCSWDQQSCPGVMWASIGNSLAKS